MNNRSIFDPERHRHMQIAAKAKLSAAFALWTEALIGLSWRSLSWVAFLFGLMLLSVPAFFGAIGWMIAGAVFWIGFLYLAIEDFKSFKAPRPNAILKRIQKDSQLDYRPLEVLTDNPAGLFTTAKKKIWSKALHDAQGDLKKIRPSFPVLCASLWDRQGFRLMALLTLVVGAIIAGGSSYDRIMRGVFPFGGLGTNEGLSYTIWIAPPRYTGVRDIVLDQNSIAAASSQSSNDTASPLIIPEGSQIKATVTGLWGPAWLTLSADWAEKSLSQKFTHSDNDSYMVDVIVPDLGVEPSVPFIQPGADTSGSLLETSPQNIEGHLALSNLIRDFAPYAISYRPDESPFIQWQDETSTSFFEDDVNDSATEDAQNTEQNNPQPDPFMDAPIKDQAKTIDENQSQNKRNKGFGMHFPVVMRDDYGVQTVELIMTLDPSITDAPLYKSDDDFIKPVRTLPHRDFNSNSYFDLSDHPWAGLPVQIALQATDQAGQSTKTQMRPFTVRERDFSHLLAKRLVYLRKKLIWEGQEAARNVAFDLRFQLQYPEDMRDDPAIWLGVKTVAERLNSAKTNDDVFPMIDMLWTLALDLEDMGLSKAARDLDRATAKITRALRRETIEDDKMLELFDSYKDSMANYLDKLREYNENRDPSTSDIPQDIMRDALNPEPLQEMLNQMEDLAEAGDYESLEDMIANLQALMESFALGGAMPPDLEAMQKGLDVLQGLIDNQKHLLKDTEELAPLVPESTKRPQKGFGEILPPRDNVIEDWQQGAMPPSPGQVPVPPREEPSRPFGTPPLFVNPNDTPKELPQSTPDDSDSAFNKDNFHDDTLPDTALQEDIQEVLRFILGELMGELYEFTDKMPETMPLAELEMRKSTRTLDDQRPDESVPVQEEVIRLLEQAQEDLQKQMQEGMEERTGMRFKPRNTDPLGRPTSPDEDMFSEESDVEVPDQFESRRIDDILEYLRKHSGDAERPRVERDYFRRLLKQF